VQTSAIQCRSAIPCHGRGMDTKRRQEDAPETKGMITMATTTPVPETATRLCPVCADDLPAEPCDNCGWERGLIVAYQKDMGDMMEVGFAAEKRHKMMLWSGALACGSGMILLIWGLATGGAAIAAGLLLGPLMFAAGVLTLKITRRGRAWWGIPAKEKALAIPGMIVGGGFGLTVLLPATLLAFGCMALFFNALGDVKSTLRAGL
jgi:hypothetical protein